MLLVLGLVIGLLFVAPALLLWTGRLIMASTGPQSAARLSRMGGSDATAQPARGSIHREHGNGEAPWFRRPMLPAFGESEADGQPETIQPEMIRLTEADAFMQPTRSIHQEGGDDGTPWFRRPTQPLLGGSEMDGQPGI